MLNFELNALPRLGRLNSIRQTPLGRTLIAMVSSIGGDMLERGQDEKGRIAERGGGESCPQWPSLRAELRGMPHPI